MESKTQQGSGQSNPTVTFTMSQPGGGTDPDNNGATTTQTQQPDRDPSELVEEDGNGDRPKIYTDPITTPQGVRASGLARTAFARFDPEETEAQIAEDWLYKDARYSAYGRI